MPSKDALAVARHRLLLLRNSGAEYTGKHCEESEISEERACVRALECEESEETPEALWQRVERIADAGNAKAAAALALDAVGARLEAERLRAEVKTVVLEHWLPAMRRWARSEDALGRLADRDRFLLQDEVPQSEDARPR
jgi:hypothetical protein